jgi:UDP-N-acetylglucosamine--N-acetylmuramyl-(pentapeptide) pyrophosphoryl-undecaprenol N-acetylglucosamine transferase
MTQQTANRKIIISGGGTGGHVFPAIAIADALCRELDDPEILFVGAKDRMEMEKVPEAGYSIKGLPVEGIRRGLSLANLRVIVKLIRSLHMAGKIIREFQPDVVVGVGGYASGPLLHKAARMGVPTMIQEQNSYAGVTNRILARKAMKICVAYEGMEKYFPADKLVMAGNPVRKEIRELSGKGNRDEARSVLGIDHGSRVLLVMGGSLGARSVNLAVSGGLDRILDSGIILIWQCGKYYYDEAREAVRNVPEGRILLRDFIIRMDHVYLAADAIIARAGAITISELCHVGKPVILVPSPNVAEDHQTKNAMALAGQSAAVLIPDYEAGERMIPEAIELLGNKDRMNVLSENISKLAISDSDARIVREAIEIMD